MAAFFEMDRSRRDPQQTQLHEASNNGKSSSDQRVKTILFFGDSLTAGYGLKPAQSFPALIQEKIDRLRLPFKSINAGVSGETTFGGNNRIDWLLQEHIDVFVLELGVNDGLRGIPVADTKSNLQSIIDKVKARYPKVTLVMAGMQVPPYLGQKFANDFRDIFPDLAKRNNMALIPFLLEGVAGRRLLNLPDGAHPSAEGQKIVAENVWAVLESVVRSSIDSSAHSTH
jgi:acyl-CoA thioesterase-1